MTTTADEAIAAVDAEATPAQQAMLVALAYAAAAESNVDQTLQAWLAGRFDRASACYRAAQVILQAIAKATLAGERFAQEEWQHRVQPRVIPATEHKRLVLGLNSITKDAQRAQAANLVKVFQVSAPAKVSEVSQQPDITMRAQRLARAEVLAAGRTGYATATAQAIGDDPEVVWKFTTDTDPCPRCVVLAARTFATFEDSPSRGGHVGCACILQAEITEG